MMTRESGKKREQIQIMSLDDLVPQEHLVRKLEAALDWNFIYEMVEEKYSEDSGRPSIDPVVLIKLPVIQYMFGLRSMRQTIREAEVNTAYRWFLGLDLQDPIPHFSTFGKNYSRRFKDTDLFEQIFQHILNECFKAGLVDASVVFVDSTHVKARANSKKYRDETVKEQTIWYEKELLEEIQKDRERHGKKPLKETKIKQDDGQEPPKSSGSGKVNRNTSKKKQARQKKEKHKKVSTSDPDSGWFRKGEHKNVFAYRVQTACDAKGIILGYSVHPGNENDGRTFPALLEKLGHLPVEIVVGDTAYKTPAIAHLLKSNGIKLLSTYGRPKTKKGFFPKYEYVYDEYYDCYICPNDQLLHYATTNRDGYREYRSCGAVCAGCPHLAQCTNSKDHIKTVTRHVWAGDLEEMEENRHTYGIREYYKLRKETIERDFALAKELHGFRYTQEYGQARMAWKAALTFACINLKKLAKATWSIPETPHISCAFVHCLYIFMSFLKTPPAFSPAGGVCLRSEALENSFLNCLQRLPFVKKDPPAISERKR